MSDLTDTARVRTIVADYVAADPQGKLNVVGGGVSILGYNPETGTTAPFTVALLASFDARFVGQSPSITLQLIGENEEVVEVPVDTGGQQHVPLQFDVNASLNPPPAHIGRAAIPSDAVRAKSQVVVQFLTGLKIQAGKYTWRVTIDGISRDDWSEDIYVPFPLSQLE